MVSVKQTMLAKVDAPTRKPTNSQRLPNLPIRAEWLASKASEGGCAVAWNATTQTSCLFVLPGQPNSR